MTGVIGVLVLIIGLIMAIWPYFTWYLRLGWKFKNAEPSDLALSAGRISGIVFVIVGFILIVSSCSTGSGAERKWEEQFNEKLDAGQVKEISIGMFNPTILSEEEKHTVIDMIQDAELRPFDTGNAFGSNNAGKITFTDETSLDIVIFGPSGGIELHPEGTEMDYEIMSDELKHWFESYYSN
ncbi:DUF6199 family natural product biosynthesis protein [Paenibacillus sp. 1781tsa1]|uniref:DUF6199 family natural product biosynthesis protein n=1 Tax=Paenibacillus sp. 1781tsa1 TaxID=2953810 RepID=UPI0020A1AB12|nr:DUF6199 family natural product biosynthesis protein [Paenibacillus sp. 1781tsa1]MCP1187489.1 hypothetical protein [Paenibacillus sp. 1781tsa1]